MHRYLFILHYLVTFGSSFAELSFIKQKMKYFVLIRGHKMIFLVQDNSNHDDVKKYTWLPVVRVSASYKA